METQDVIHVPPSTYRSSIGSFAPLPTGSQRVNWHACRETFHRALSRRVDKGWLFSCRPADKQRIRDFITECEKRLRVRRRCVIIDTDNSGVLACRPGSWWSLQSIRLSLLTILFRCGASYNGDFQTALFSQSYTRNTKPAVDRFFAGYTWYVGAASMWVAAFHSYFTRIDIAERVLVREKDIRVSKRSLEEARHILVSSRGMSLEFQIAKIGKAIDIAFEKGRRSLRIKRLP